MEPVVPAAERGALRIAERVVAKIAAEAAREAVAVASQAPPPVPRRDGGGTHATAVVRRQPDDEGRGGQASVEIAVELCYPSDIGAQCGAVRRQVASRLRELTGMDASHVAVAVERLHAVDGDGRATPRDRAGRVR